MKSLPLFAAAVVGLASFAGCGDSSSGTASNTSTLVGGPCMNGSDCDKGLCQSSSQFPGGVCTLSCGNTGQCPSNSTCAELLGGWVCLVNCDTTEECRTQWSCQLVTEAGTNGGSFKNVCVGPLLTE